MKKTLLIILALAGLLSALNATAETVITNEFWICNSTNTAGLGTLDNPYDGSTATKFDTVMSHIPPNSTVHILTGTYETEGGWHMLSGQKIIGSGRDNTILQIAPGAPGPCVIADGGLCCGVAGTNEEVADLTCDANFQGGAYSYDGVELNGTGIIVRRVRVIHCGTGQNLEVFGICISNDWSPLTMSQGNIIEDCEVSELSGGHSISAIGISGAAGTAITGIIRNNVVLLSADPAGAASQFGISCGQYTTGILIEGNYVNGADCAIHGDQGGWTNETILNNNLVNCFFGINMTAVGVPEKNITIAFNNIDLNTTNSVAFHFWNGIFTNVLIFGNTISSDCGTGPTRASLIAANNITGLVLENNSIDAQIAQNQAASGAYGITNSINLSIDNNYDLFGNYLYDLNMPMLGGVAVSPFGLSLVNNANAASALTNLGLPSNPAAVVTNNETGVTLSGTFSGNGSGLTNISASSLPFYSRAGTTNFTGGTLVVNFSSPVPDTNYALYVATHSGYTVMFSQKTTNGFTVSKDIGNTMALDYIAVQNH